MFNYLLEISTLDIEETAQIVAHYNRLASKQETNSVWDAYRERGMSEEQIAVLKERVKDQVGREVDAEYRSMGLQFTTSLENFEYPLMGQILTMYELWEKGTMPDSGPLLDQPNKIVEIMNLISGLKAEQTEKMYKEQERAMQKARK